MPGFGVPAAVKALLYALLRVSERMYPAESRPGKLGFCMNRNVDELQRTTGDFILFGVVFVGFVFGIVGVVTTSLPACLTGLFLIGAGLGCFMLKNALQI
jgi:hypothetical protein